MDVIWQTKRSDMEKSIFFRGTKLSYTIHGHGHPVVLLHGFGEDSSIWEFQVEALRDHAMVITPDLAGSGRSGWPETAAGFLTLEDHAESVLEILHKEQIENCILIGHSMGGYIALAFAERYPERLKALGLFHSTASADSEEKKLVRQKGIEFTREQGAGKFLAQVIPNLYGEAYKTAHPEALARHIALAQSFSRDAVIGYYKAMMQRPDRKSVLQNFAKPVLFIMGEEDKTVLLQETLPQSHLAQESHVFILKQVAHMGMREDPSQANAALLGFLSHVNEN
jgi:pimeloyl-ACP methyl ester carboxylesterase